MRGAYQMAKRPLCVNVKSVFEAISQLENDMQKRKRVDTAFGSVDPSHGYTISAIRVQPRFVSIDVYMHERSVKKSDCIRDGDKAYFFVGDDKVFSQKEYELLCQNED